MTSHANMTTFTFFFKRNKVDSLNTICHAQLIKRKRDYEYEREKKAKRYCEAHTELLIALIGAI